MTASVVDATPKEPFRADINGLRAWAVGLVLLYHFKVPPFSGGFVGVDVFFVISGYLMTSILLADSSKKASLSDFYLKRLIRILPALAVLCVVLMLGGWWFLSAPEFLALARQVGWSLAGASNQLFLSEAGYFDASAYDKWLLHTWSLSVEMQFYLTYPLALLLLRRLTGDHFRRAIIGLAIISLLACLMVGPVEPPKAFFSLVTRAWELLAGAAIWLFGRSAPISPLQGRYLESLGILMIVGAACAYSPEMLWPSAWALVPVAGSALVLVGKSGTTLLTTHTWAQWLGFRSYSLYLWHWPVIVLLHFLAIELQLQFMLAAIAFSIMLAAVSYRWVEQVFLQSGRGIFRGRLGVAMASVPLLVAFAIQWADGVPGRLPPEVDMASSEAGNRLAPGMRCDSTGSKPWKVCTLGGERISAVLIGDSHAQSVASALRQAAGGRDAGIRSWTYPGCIPLFGAHMVSGVLRSGSQCHEFNAWVRDAVARLPPDIPIVLVSRSSAYVHGDTEPGSKGKSRPAVHFGTAHETPDSAFAAEFSRAWVDTACQLSQRRRVFLMRPIPEMPSDVPKAVSRRLAMGNQHFPTLSSASYEQRHSQVLAAQDAAQAHCARVIILDPRSALCSNGICRSTEGKRPLYYDDDHLSEYGNKLLVPLFELVFKDI